MIHYIDEGVELEGKRVLLRLDLNVPIEDGKVVDPYRLERAIETVDFLRGKKAQTIIIAHTESNTKSADGTEVATLLPMFDYLNGFFPLDFCPTYFTPEAVGKLLELKDGGVLLFENVRMNEGEKKNDPEFAAKLAQMADIYVDDAFSVMHRAHASIVGVPALLPHYGGLVLRQEIENLSKVFSPDRPFLFILGGAKFDTKLPIIKKYLKNADNVFVGGALVNNFLKVKGIEIGTSLVDDGDFGIKEMLASEDGKKLLLPIDATVQSADGSVSFKKINEIGPTDYIGDTGPDTIEMLKPYVASAKTIVWNGPLGNYEKGFTDKTEQCADMIAAQTVAGTTTIVGGGDTLASIKKLGIDDKFTFISTGGGAMLDFLVNETLVGIEALEK